MGKHRKTTLDEAIGVVLLGLGVLLLLALVSYDPADLPPWVFFSHVSPHNERPENFIGIAGALVAGGLYFMIGGAAYFLAAILLGFGVAKLFGKNFSLRGRIGWCFLSLLCAAALFHILPLGLDAWKSAFKIEGPGGWFGYYLGGRAFVSTLGEMGSLIVLVTLYAASVILLSGFNPIKSTKAAIAAIGAALARESPTAPEPASDLFPPDEDRAPRRPPARRRRQKPPEPEPDAAPEEVFPEPKIIDATAPVPAKKPTLDELRPKSKSKDPALGLSEVRLENYTLPGIDLLDPIDETATTKLNEGELAAIQDTIIDTLDQFGIKAARGDITRGPTITRFELYPPKGVRVDKIASLERDIARATRAERINILAPIPGKDTVGIEIANSKKVKVTLRELFESEAWCSSTAVLPLALGKDVYGNPVIADLAQMPHGLVGGTTGSGKSVCINAIVASVLYRFSPEDLRFIMIDPKVVELQGFNRLPHLVFPVVTEPKKVLSALSWVINEMEVRYRIFAECKVRNIAGFNARPKPKSQAELDAENAAAAPGQDLTDAPTAESGEEPENGGAAAIRVPREDDLVIPDRMPYIIVIIDELADLMQTAPADVESAIARITQMARAAGIHMIVATQTPRADVVTGVIKANIPSRIAFQVASKIDSRVILDQNGAEKLLGKGDMLYLPPGSSKPVRSQGVLVTEDEMNRIVDFVASNGGPEFDRALLEKIESPKGEDEDVSAEDEELAEKCLAVIKQTERASVSLLQRRLRIGYGRAGRMMDILEQRGIVGPKDGARDREILVDLSSLP